MAYDRAPCRNCVSTRRTTARSTSASATPCGASWRARSHRTCASGTRPASFPRGLYRQAAEVGLLGLGFPEEYGGVAATDSFHRLVAGLELAQCGSGGVVASLLSHTIGAPPVLALGSAELKARVLPPVLRGEQIAALAITEPSRRLGRGGAAHHARSATAITTSSTARRPSSPPACAPTTSPSRCAPTPPPAARAASRCCSIEGDTAGLTRAPLEKMGWWASDTAQLRFDGCRVPAGNLLGAPGAGFRAIMQNFNAERFGMAAGALGFAWVCYQEALGWARERRTFGQRLADHQVVRHRLVDMLTRIEATRALVEDTAWRLDHAPAGDAETRRRGVHAEEPRDAHDAVLRRRAPCRRSAAWATCVARTPSASTARSRST